MKQTSTRGVGAVDGYRTSADGLTRTKIAPDAAAPTVPSECVTLRMGADGRLHTPGVVVDHHQGPEPSDADASKDRP